MPVPLAILGLATWLVSIGLNGWAASVLWRWFVVPFGAPQLTVGWAVGLMSVLGVFVSMAPEERPGVALFMAFARPLLCLAIGYGALHFM